MYISIESLETNKQKKNLKKQRVNDWGKHKRVCPKTETTAKVVSTWEYQKKERDKPSQESSENAKQNKWEKKKKKYT